MGCGFVVAKEDVADTFDVEEEIKFAVLECAVFVSLESQIALFAGLEELCVCFDLEVDGVDKLFAVFE